MKKTLLFLSIFCILSCSTDDIHTNYDELSFINGEQARWVFTQRIDSNQEKSIIIVFSLIEDSFQYFEKQYFQSATQTKNVSKESKGRILSYDFPYLKMSYRPIFGKERIIHAVLNPEKSKMVLEGNYSGISNPCLIKKK